MPRPAYLFERLRSRVLRPALCLLALIVFSPTGLVAQTGLPSKPPDHIVIVIEENRSREQVDYFIEHHDKSYLARLKQEGAYFTSFFARLHPSQPNYIELFSGERHDIWNDDRQNCAIAEPSIGGELRKQGRTFIGYAEGLPQSGFDGKQSGSYVRKHCPWINFSDVPTSSSLPFTEFPRDPKGFGNLPTLSYVIPDLTHDMHGKPLQLALGFVLKLFKKDPLMNAGDVWLEQNLKAYAEWAKTNNSLLIVTWDEDDSQKCSEGNKTMFHPCETVPPKNNIPTIFVGEMVNARPIPTQYTHQDLLRTLEDMYGLPRLGGSKNATVITGVWK